MRNLSPDRKRNGRHPVSPLQIEAFESRTYLTVIFANPQTLPRSAHQTNVGSIVTGDFGNGHPDIAALDQGANGTAGSIQIFLNNGAGKFSFAQTLSTGSGSQVMQAVDLYGNGKLDLIVSNAGDGTLDIFAGNGDGTFATSPVVFTFGPKEVFNGTSVFSDPFQVGDLLGPGSPNGIVIANQYAGNTIVLQLDANQQLNLAQTFAEPLANFALIDVTGDSLPDIVESSTTDITAFTNLGGTFDNTVPSSFSLGLPADFSANYPNITTGDFAGNGLTDLAVSAQPDSTLLDANAATPGVLSVLMAQPGGGFAAAVLSNEPNDVKAAVSADFNADNETDLLTQSTSSSDVLLGNGDGTFTDQNLHIPNAGVGQFALADFNGDGTIDFVTVNNKLGLALYANKTVSPDFGSSDLSPIVSRTTLPSAIVAGSKTHGTAVVAVTDTDTKEEQAIVTTSVYASSDGLFDDSATMLGSVTRKLVIKPGATISVTVPIKSLPASLNGSYQLLAQTANAAGSVDTETGPTLTISAPFIAFSDAFTKTTLPASAVSGQRSTATLEVLVTNDGNIVSKGNSSIAIYASTDGIAADGTLIRTEVTAIALQPGGSRRVTVPLQALPAVADGDYFLTIQITDPLANVTTAVSPGTYHLAAPFVSLVPSITATTLPDAVTSGSKSNAILTLAIANTGNVPPVGMSTVAVYASPDGIPGDGTLLISQPVQPIRPQHSAILRVPIRNFGQLAIASYYLVAVVTDPTGTSQSVVSTTSYAVGN